MKMREERCVLFVKFAYCWCMAFTFLNLRDLHDANVWHSDADAESLRRTLTQRACWRTITAIAIVFILRARSCTVVADCLHVMFVMSSSVYLLFSTDLLNYSRMLLVNNAGRLVMAALFGRVRHVFVLNSLHWGCQISLSVRSDILEHAMESETIVFFLCVIVAVFTEWHMHRDAQATVAAASSACSEAAVKKMLSILCDAVVHLDEHLMLIPPCPKLDALLLRVNETVGAGAHFPSLLLDVDADRFMECVHAGDGLGQSLYVHLRDSCGALVDAQLFHHCFADVAGSMRHIIGVIEAPNSHRAPPPAVLSTVPCVLNETSGDGHISRCASYASDSSTDYVPLQFSQGDELIGLWIDCGTPNLRILSCTTTFTNISGPLEQGAGLLDMAFESDKVEFFTWVQQVGTSEDFDERDPAAAFSLRLHTQNIRLATRCRKHYTPDAVAPWCISLFDVRRLVSQRQGRASDLRGTTARARHRVAL